MATEKQDQAPQDEEIDEESDGESVEIKDGSCGGCDQEFGAQDEAGTTWENQTKLAKDRN